MRPVIREYPLPGDASFSISLPRGAHVLSVRTAEDERQWLCAVVDDDNVIVERKFFSFFADEPWPEAAWGLSQGSYIGLAVRQGRPLFFFDVERSWEPRTETELVVAMVRMQEAMDRLNALSDRGKTP